MDTITLLLLVTTISVIVLTILLGITLSENTVLKNNKAESDEFVLLPSGHVYRYDFLQKLVDDHFDKVNQEINEEIMLDSFKE